MLAIEGFYVDENNVKYFNETFYENYQARLELFRDQNQNAFPGGIVFIGNSITQGFDLEKYFPGMLIYNRGIVGDQIGIGDYAGVSKRLKESCYDLAPASIFLMIGVNDIGSRSVQNLALGYEEVVQAIFDSFPMAELYVQSVLPTSGNYSSLNPHIDSLNNLLKIIVDNKSFFYFIRYVDLNSEFKDSAGNLKTEYSYDGVHLSQEGFDRWAEFISPLINKNFFFQMPSDSVLDEDLLFLN
ncbi:hypothetical protein JXA84_00080 [candidate division WOR-3 bacterium]|nr:hypothetical protein [candidate division WOR-3 bacterium]